MSSCQHLHSYPWEKISGSQAPNFRKKIRWVANTIQLTESLQAKNFEISIRMVYWRLSPDVHRQKRSFSRRSKLQGYYFEVGKILKSYLVHCLIKNKASSNCICGSSCRFAQQKQVDAFKKHLQFHYFLCIHWQK